MITPLSSGPKPCQRNQHNRPLHSSNWSNVQRNLFQSHWGLNLRPCWCSSSMHRSCVKASAFVMFPHTRFWFRLWFVIRVEYLQVAIYLHQFWWSNMKRCEHKMSMFLTPGWGRPAIFLWFMRNSTFLFFWLLFDTSCTDMWEVSILSSNFQRTVNTLVSPRLNYQGFILLQMCQ